MLHRLLAVLAYPAHVLNLAMAGLMGRIGLGWLPAAAPIGVLLLLLTVSTGSATLAAGDARPEPQATTIAEVGGSGIVSGTWVELDAELVDGPYRSAVEVSAGGGQASTVERVHYLVADPAAPDQAMIVRFTGPVASLETSAGPVRLDGTVTEDRFALRSLIAEWGIADLYPDLAFSESRLLAYAFATPFQEPSWLGTVVLGVLAGVLLLGAFVPLPLLRLSPATPRPGELPIELTIDGTLTTPRGPVRLRATPARLEWMNVEDVARTRWRYWGAGLGDVRNVVEEAVTSHGAGQRLVIHGPTGSVIWPIETSSDVAIEAGDAYAGLSSHPAIRVRGDGARATLTFADAASRDAAAAELQRGEGGP